MGKKKIKFILKCDCGKEIIGFSKHHAKMNLDIHKKTSKYHKKVIALLKEKGLK